jgi:hypothetical protein
VIEVRLRVGEGAQWVRVGPGLGITSPLFVDATDVAGYDVTLRVEPAGGRLIGTELLVSQRPGGPPITVENIRNLSIAPLIRAAAERLESELDPEAGQYRTPEVDLAPENIARLLKNGATTETLDVAAYVYRRAVALGEPPAKAIMDTFGLTRSKAGRWISQAREQGLLGPSEGPGKASV